MGCLPLALPVFVGSQVAQRGSARYLVETRETATFLLGQEGQVNVVLLDQSGNRVDAPQNFQATITLTTMESLDQAKQLLARRAANKQMARQAAVSRDRKIVLARGQQASQITIVHRQGEEDEIIHVLSYETGRLHVFVESPGVATGETAIVVLGSKTTASNLHGTPGLPTDGVMLMPVLWQGNDPARLKLEISPAKPFIQTAAGEQIAYFRVELKSVEDNEYIGAPEDIRVILSVDEGNARFEPDTLLIPRGDANTREQSALRTRPGGHITISAGARRTAAFKIASAKRSHEFSPGTHSTSLAVSKQRESAFANGLDEIELRVEALQGERAITPEEEGMEERIIFFTLLGDAEGVRFENNISQVHIAKGQHSAAIKLFSTRPVEDLKVVAKSRNGLREEITSEGNLLPVKFSFPWLQLLCAMIGGAIFPLLLKQNRWKLAQGIALGAVFFGLALFGAIASDPQNIGSISVSLAKLPTENFFASLVLGFLSVTLLGVIFKWQAERTGNKVLAKARGK
jgi:hypothetical protein